MPIDFPSFLYAGAVAAGGILGYVKSNSIPSLGAGLLFGGVLGYGAYQISSTPPQYSMFLGSSAALGGIMGYRFYNTGKIMPAGVIAIMSAAMVVRTIFHQFRTPALRTD
ncbi:transmembrane protein 14C [Venturia canescens]|uniref:transmembrane protein 14C n=1 Tax=Venturia canescens TaxID=32260 RepID=UPI001C9D60BF|nr:transmembrane protein 14C [Venturia canescens]